MADTEPTQHADYERLASVLRRLESGDAYFSFGQIVRGAGEWHLFIDGGVYLTDDEAEAVRRVLQNGGKA